MRPLLDPPLGAGRPAASSTGPPDDFEAFRAWLTAPPADDAPHWWDLRERHQVDRRAPLRVQVRGLGLS